MKHILVPTDFSENALNAIAYATALFQNTNCRFYLLHVAALDESGVESNRILPSISTKEKLSKEKLKNNLLKIKQSFANTDHQFFTLLEYGNLIDKIRMTIADKNIDLIVMGTKGASGIKETIIGSNTGDVITKVPVNLLVVPDKAKYSELKEISFSTDYTVFYSYSILKVLTELVQISLSNLQVINATTQPKLNANQIKNKAYLQDYLEEVFEENHSFHKLKNKSVKNAIEDFTINNRTDMVIMVAKNLNFLQQILFDSTIKKLSFHSIVPLFVIHE